MPTWSAATPTARGSSWTASTPAAGPPTARAHGWPPARSRCAPGRGLRILGEVTPGPAERAALLREAAALLAPTTAGLERAKVGRALAISG
jgi:hypothetical protein